MDDKGYTFTPLVFLLIIPVVIIATSYSDIVNEVNAISQIAIGGDVTYDAANNIVLAVEKGMRDAGRNAAYNATRQVIDNEAKRYTNPFLSDSKGYVKSVLAGSLNSSVVETCKQIEAETGRQVYVKNIPITNSTSTVLTASDIEINQTDPYGFYITVKEGIPITVTQNDQNFTGYTPEITTYVSIEGLEDPYIWVKSLDRRSYVFYKYQYYITYMGNLEYHFDDDWDKKYPYRLYNLWHCINGTGSSVELRPYYFPDPNGLTFFDRLEGGTTSSGPDEAKMSTFIIGEPLYEEFGAAHISSLDHEYFAGVPGTKTIEVKGNVFKDPVGSDFYLSNNYFTYFNLKDSYN